MSEETWLTLVWVLVLLGIGYVVVDLLVSGKRPHGAKRGHKQRRRTRPGGTADRRRDPGEGASGAHVDETPF